LLFVVVARVVGAAIKGEVKAAAERVNNGDA
jgi:hypothetical protein